MMKKTNLWLGAALVFALSAVICFKLFEPVFVYRVGWAPMPKEAPAAVSEVRDVKWAAQAQVALAALEAARKKIQAPALSAAVSIDGQMVWRGAVGFADVEAGTATNFDTRFRLGSTSKAITAIAVGKLIDQGKLNLDQPIQDYVSAYPAQKWPVTLGQVMSHRAGIRDYGLCLCFPIWEHQNRRPFKSVDEEVALVANSALEFEPGTNFQYTSPGYNLAGAAVEKASGETFGTYLANAVFQPLGMMRSSLDESGAAGFYETQVDGGQYRRAFAVDNSIRWPSGGIVSTPTDMVAIGNAMLDDRLLTPKTRQLLVTVPAQGRTTRGKIYAYGWRHSDWSLYDGKLKLDSYHHAGTAVGSTSILLVLPERKIVLSLLMNKGGENVNDLAAVADRILQAYVPAP